MARLDTIRALERRGLSPKLAKKTVDLGYQLGTLKKCGLRELKKHFNYKEILQLIDVSKNKKIDRDEIVARALEQGNLQDGPITAARHCPHSRLMVLTSYSIKQSRRERSMKWRLMVMLRRQR